MWIQGCTAEAVAYRNKQNSMVRTLRDARWRSEAAGRRHAARARSRADRHISARPIVINPLWQVPPSRAPKFSKTHYVGKLVNAAGERRPKAR
jgi:hypothetical protein